MNFVPNWRTCQEDIEPVCIGIQASGFDRCLAHLGDDDLEHVLSRLGPDADLDVCGTTFNPDLLAQLLQAVSHSA